jgi:uracil-DNA glycosylase
MEISMEGDVRYMPKCQDLGKNPVFIVGMCPGKQRKNADTKIVWEGNRSGDFISEILKDRKNLYFTNGINFFVNGKIGKDKRQFGRDELYADMVKYDPSKVICLGDFAAKAVDACIARAEAQHKARIKQDRPGLYGVPVIKMTHPGYVLRFNKGKDEYAKELLEAVDRA